MSTLTTQQTQFISSLNISSRHSKDMFSVMFNIKSDVFYRLCLPEGVDNWTPLLSHNIVIPEPGLRVYGFTNRTQHTQTWQIIPKRERDNITVKINTLSFLCAPVTAQCVLLRVCFCLCVCFCCRLSGVRKCVCCVHLSVWCVCVCIQAHRCSGSRPYFISSLIAVGAV